MGHVGGGTVEFAGYIGYANGLTVNLTSEGHDIRFRYSGLSVTANQELKLQGTLKNMTISGDITITRFAQIPSADLAAAFANTSAPVPNATSPLKNLHLDVHVRSAPELTVQTSLAKLSGDADLRLKGTALNPVLLGRVNIAQGDFKINGQKYFLERGDMTFANPVRIDPLLDVEAKTRVRDFDITIGLHGTLERLSTTYRSDPPLSSEDIISLLTLGRTQQEYSQPTSTGCKLGSNGQRRYRRRNQPTGLQPRLPLVWCERNTNQSRSWRSRQQSQRQAYGGAAGFEQRHHHLHYKPGSLGTAGAGV